MRTLSIEVSDSLYDKFWEIRDRLHPDATHTDVIDSLIARYNGKRKPHPEILRSVTSRVNVPVHQDSVKIYVRIDLDHNEEPFDVFIEGGVSGGQFQSYNEALGKTISNALRSGAMLDVIADDLLGIRGPYTPALDCGNEVLSFPDGVGIVLKRFVEGKLPDTPGGSPDPIDRDGDPEMGVGR